MKEEVFLDLAKEFKRCKCSDCITFWEKFENEFNLIDKQKVKEVIDAEANKRHPAQSYPNWATNLKKELGIE